MMGDPRELFWEDEGLTEGLTDEEAQFLLGWLMDVAEALDPAHLATSAASGGRSRGSPGTTGSPWGSSSSWWSWPGRTRSPRGSRRDLHRHALPEARQAHLLPAEGEELA